MGRKVAPAVIMLIVVGLLCLTYAGPNGLLHLRELNNELSLLEQKNRTIEEEMRRVKSSISMLKSGQFELERIAREELGLAKDGEIIYVFDPKAMNK